MAPGKAERYHGQVKWHQTSLYVTMGKTNGTKQGCTLPWAGKMASSKAYVTMDSQMAPSQAECYHGQVKWHQAGLYVTMGR